MLKFLIKKLVAKNLHQFSLKRAIEVFFHTVRTPDANDLYLVQEHTSHCRKYPSSTLHLLPEQMFTCKHYTRIMYCTNTSHIMYKLKLTDSWYDSFCNSITRHFTRISFERGHPQKTSALRG